MSSKRFIFRESFGQKDMKLFLKYLKDRKLEFIGNLERLWKYMNKFLLSASKLRQKGKVQ